VGGHFDLPVMSADGRGGGGSVTLAEHVRRRFVSHLADDVRQRLDVVLGERQRLDLGRSSAAAADEPEGESRTI